MPWAGNIAKTENNSKAREWRHDSDKTQTNKLEWWMILKISLRAKASVPKTLVKQKLRLYSMYFPQNTLMLTEYRGEFSDLHSIFRLRALRYSLLPTKCWPLLHVTGDGLMSSLESQRVFHNLLLFCYITNHLWLVPWGTVNFVPLESQCFPWLRLGKHWDSWETKFTVPQGTSHLEFIVTITVQLNIHRVKYA